MDAATADAHAARIAADGYTIVEGAIGTRSPAELLDATEHSMVWDRT